MRRKKLKSIMSAFMIITFLFTVGFLPVSADKTDETLKETEPSVESMELSEDETIEATENQGDELSEETEEEIIYPIKVSGIEVTQSNAADILEDGTAVYDPATNTLTLKDADISAEGSAYGLYSNGDLNLVLEGENKITTTYYYGIAVVDPQSANSAVLTISGSGSLYSHGSDGGIFIRGSLVVEGEADILATCGDVGSGDAYGIRAFDDVTISGNSTVKAKSGSAPNYSYALYAGDNLIIEEQAQVEVEAGKGVARSCGMYAISNLYVKDEAKAKTVGCDTSESSDFASESYGIRTTHMYVEGGSLEAVAQGATGSSTGIFTQDLDLSGGILIAKSVNPVAGQSMGLMATKTLTVSGGELIANGGDTTADSWAIDAEGSEVQITGGSIIAVSGSGDYTYGLNANSVTISGGDVKLTASDAGSQARGIRTDSDTIINGGNVEVIVGDTESQSYGIQTGSKLLIEGGKVNVTKGSAERGSALYAWEIILIQDAEVSIHSLGHGIYAPYGKISIGATQVDFNEDYTKLIGTDIYVNAVNAAVWAQNGLDIADSLKVLLPENGIITYEESEEGSTAYYVSSEDGVEAREVKIGPAGYEFTIQGLDQEVALIVPEGQSVNDTYCEIYQVNDFSETLDTTKEGYIFEGFYLDEACTEGSEYNFDMAVTADTVIYAKWIKVIVYYNVNVESNNGGTVNVSNTAPQAGEMVTITVKPNNRYQLKDITVVDVEGNKIELEKVDQFTYTYEQPEEDVNVKVTFKSYSDSKKDYLQNMMNKITEKIQNSSITKIVRNIFDLFKKLF